MANLQHLWHIRSRNYAIAVSAVGLVVIGAIVAGIEMRPDHAVQHTTTAQVPASTKSAETVQPTAESQVQDAAPAAKTPSTRLVDNSSAGPEKLTYREDKRLIMQPSTVTLYAPQGIPVTTPEQISQVFQTVQVMTDDGQPVGFPVASSVGKVYFAVRTKDVPFTPSLAIASWPMTADASNAAPGTYTITFIGWSSDHQVRYTGTLQVVIVPLAQ
jgi:hypothetical protein